MIAKKQIKHNTVNKNVTKAAFIQYHLKRNGFTQKQVAEELNISPVAVSRAINGQSTIARVSEWLEQNLRLEGLNG